jgi:HK97 family phage major capsid protein
VGHLLAGSALDRPAVWPANLEGSFMTVYSADFSAEEVAYLRSQVAAGDTSAKAILDRMRTPSMAGIIGSGSKAGLPWDGATRSAPAIDAHPYLKASLSDAYIPGAFITAVAGVRSGDADEQRTAKASLVSLGLDWAEAPATAKATLGDSGATGGYVLPNNLVDQVVKPSIAAAMFTNGATPLLTVRPGVNVRGVDLPYRTGAPPRMVTSQWGTAKQNLDEAYGSYSATLLTIARIMDVGKQYLRFSAGSAEQDVLDELTRAAALGESYYVLAGNGGAGTGGEPMGILPAIVASDPVYTTTFAGASTGTIAGAAASGIAAGIKALARRSRHPSAVVMDATTYWTILTEGSDTAGFWLDARASGGFSFASDGGLQLWGVPILQYENFDLFTGTTKACIIADWSAAKFFRGMEFRIESSDQAGSRWDNNLIGFRGEEEIGFHAGPAVATGAFQLVKALIP